MDLFSVRLIVIGSGRTLFLCFLGVRLHRTSAAQSGSHPKPGKNPGIEDIPTDENGKKKQ